MQLLFSFNLSQTIGSANEGFVLLDKLVGQEETDSLYKDKNQQDSLVCVSWSVSMQELSAQVTKCLILKKAKN